MTATTIKIGITCPDLAAIRSVVNIIAELRERARKLQAQPPSPLAAAGSDGNH